MSQHQNKISQTFTQAELASQGYLNPSQHPAVEKPTISHDELMRQGYINPDIHPALEQPAEPLPITTDAETKASSDQAVADGVFMAEAAMKYMIDGTSGVVMLPEEAATNQRAGEAIRN